MKFVYFGYDFMLPAIKRLIADGHELAGVFSFPVDNIFNFNNETKALAQEHGKPFTLQPAKDKHLQPYIDDGVECFLSAGYPHKIPPIDEKDAYAVNVHPTRLPKGRGLMPIPPIILNNITDAAGITAHKMTQEFDAGDILVQRQFDLLPTETVETYTAKIAMRAPDMFSELMADLPGLWNNAAKQDQSQATYLKPPTNEERVLSFDNTVEQIDKITRAFGRFGSIVKINERFWVVFDCDVWKEKHDYRPGTAVAKMSREIVIAIKDGFICIKDYQLIEN